MGEVRRMREQGIQLKQMKPDQPIRVDLRNAQMQVCSCGSKFFIPAVQLYKVSALVSPTGQELLAQQPVLVCQRCGVAYENAPIAGTA